MSKLNVTYTDYGGETTTVGLRGQTITSANYDAEVLKADNLRTALDGITLGVQKKWQLIASDILLSTALAASAVAQRESKWLVTYHDTTSGKQYQSEIGTAEWAGNLVAGSEFADLTDGGVIQAFVVAFQAFVRAPDDLSHSVAVDSIRAVSRNT